MLLYKAQYEKSLLDGTNYILVTLFIRITAFRSYEIYFEGKERYLYVDII